MGVAGWRFAHVKRTLRVRAVLVGLLEELPFICPVVVAVGSTVMIVIKLCKDLPQRSGPTAKALMCTPLCTERHRIKSRLRDCKYPQAGRSRGPPGSSRLRRTLTT